MKPRHDIPSFRSAHRGAKGRRSSTSSAIDALTDRLVDRALLQMKRLMDQDLLSVGDIEKLQSLLAANRGGKAKATARHELLLFIEELMKRDGPPPGASPMPAPVFPRGGPPPLADGAEAPLD